MENHTRKIRVIKEKEKLNQVTHWDLDYLPKDEVQELYEHKTGHADQTGAVRQTSGESKQKASLLLIAIGVLLLAVSLYVASLI